MKRKIVTKKSIAHTLSLAMLTTTVLGGSVLGMAGAQEVQAAAPSAEIKKGDHVSMGVADDSYVGTPSWIVLDTADTDGDGAADKAYLLSEYLWKDKEGSDTLIFNQMGKGNKWDSSNVKTWCENFYKNVLKESDLVKETDISDVAYKDGAYKEGESKANKVFFLSAEEADNAEYFKDNAARMAYFPGEKYANAWWTRSTAKMVNRVGSVSESGTLGNANIMDNTKWARPAFYMDLTKDICISKSDNEDVTTWSINVEDTGHKYGEPEYIWSEDNSSCEACTICENCGNEINEKGTVTSEVTKEATEQEEGNTAYTATFTNDKFQTQVKNVPIEKLPAKPEPTPEPKPEPKPEKKIVAGAKYTIAGSVYKVLSPKAKTVSVVKAKNIKSYTISSTIKIAGKTFKVTQVEAKSLKGAKIAKVTVGKNVKTLKKNAFAGSKATKVVLKTKSLKKSQIKDCMKSSKVKTVYVKVGTKEQNKKMVKSYKKIFKKSVVGKSVTVK